ncbi:MAG: FCD domain-containing protein [Acidobacteria bacterium]|nr:FCD domain-containing protein [Acidobacteriota bacterium]
MTPSPQRPVRARRPASAVRKLADQVHQRLRADILARTYKPGERLDIPALAESFGVSQMPVRQAVGRLADAGLVEVKPRSGTYVATLDAKEISDTFDVRCALERLAAESAVRNVTDKDLALLEGILSGLAQAVAANDAERHDELNSELHDRLIKLSGNPKLVQVYEELNAHIKIARIHLENRDWSYRTDLESAEHRAILTALRHRSAPELAAALTTHIERSKDVLLADIRKSS